MYWVRSQGPLLRSIPRWVSHPHPQLQDRLRAPQVVHCALQCTYYALLWQIVAATDRLPPQVGDGRGGGQVWSAVVWEEGKMERDRAVIAALTGVRPHHWLASVLPGSGQGSWTLT